MISSSVPTLQSSPDELLGLIDAMVSVEAVASKGEGRRLIKQNAVAANGTKLNDENTDLREHRAGGDAVILSVGKAKRFLVRF